MFYINENSIIFNINFLFIIGYNKVETLTLLKAISEWYVLLGYNMEI
jgi:hypothetical protein